LLAEINKFRLRGRITFLPSVCATDRSI
jgi:hypothetical protein